MAKGLRSGRSRIATPSHYEIFPEIPDRWNQIHRRTLADETVSDDRYRFERLDGSIQWLKWLVRPWYESDRTIGGIVIFSEDITARVLVEEKLPHSEQRYRCLIESESDVVWHCRRIGDRIDVPRWYKLAGQTAEQADGSWQECIHPDDRNQVVPAWLQLSNGAESSNISIDCDFGMASITGSRSMESPSTRRMVRSTNG